MVKTLQYCYQMKYLTYIGRIPVKEQRLNHLIENIFIN